MMKNPNKNSQHNQTIIPPQTLEPVRNSYHLCLKNLKLLRDRYFWCNIPLSLSGIRHHGDCNIYRSIDVYGYCFCSCGLLHDLDKFTDGFEEVLYPSYWNDYWLQEHGEHVSKEDMQKERKDAKKILAECNINLAEQCFVTIKDMKNQYEKKKSLLKTCFGNKFPSAFTRLEEQFKEEVKFKKL